MIGHLYSPVQRPFVTILGSHNGRRYSVHKYWVTSNRWPNEHAQVLVWAILSTEMSVRRGSIMGSNQRGRGHFIFRTPFKNIPSSNYFKCTTIQSSCLVPCVPERTGSILSFDS